MINDERHKLEETRIKDMIDIDETKEEPDEDKMNLMILTKSNEKPLI